MGGQWLAHQETCRELYVTEGKTLAEIVDYMKKHHGFSKR